MVDTRPRLYTCPTWVYPVWPVRIASYGFRVYEAFLPAIDFSAIYSRLLREAIAPGSIAYAGLNEITGSLLGSQEEVV